MTLTKQTRREAKELFRSCLVDGLLDEARVRQAVTQVLARRPRGFVGVLAHFKRLVKLELQRHAARIESPAPLSPALTAAVERELARLHGRGLRTTFVTNPALIGGLRVRLGYTVFDGSVQARLAALRESF